MDTVTIELTQEDVETLIEALGVWMEQPETCEGEEWVRRQDLGADLDMDLREAWARKDDGWGDSVAPDLETQMFNAGVEAREQIKETSRAATRREQRRAQAISDGNPDPSNDPVDW
jgi:hypothetical protein|tara:strand:- start:2108 stop:2455 length:348 start_codon:yes stop_codon:yes gene_type:complete